jgi:curved DNA-binding protein CbpA
MTPKTRFRAPLRIALVAFATWGVAFRLGVAAEDPASGFLSAYQTVKSAERLEVDGNFDPAIEKYREAIASLEEIQENSPDYEPVVIEFRLGKSREGLARVEQLAEQPNRAPAMAKPGGDFGLEGPLPTEDFEISEPALTRPAPAPSRPRPTPSIPQPTPTRLPNFTTYRIPTPGAPARPAPTPVPRWTPPPMDYQESAPAIGRGAAEANEREIRALRQRLLQAEKQAEALAQKLLESQAGEQMAQRETDRTKVSVVELKAQLAMARQSLDDSEALNARLNTARGQDANRIEKLEADLVAAKADLEVAEEYNGELFAKLERAASFIEASESIRNQLLADRTILAERADSELSDETQRIASENITLREERDAAAAGAAQSEQLTQANADLAAKLTAAEDRVQQLAALDPEKEKLVADLRAELSSVNETLRSLREERAAGRARITELDTQLEATANAAASATGAIAEENELLKAIVTRQIRDQAKRQQARQLVEEEMVKLKVRSTTLIDQLDALGEAETNLTAREERIVRGPLAATPDVAASGGGLNFSMAIVKSAAAPENDLPAELLSRASEAFAFLNANDYESAARAYGEISKEAPGSYFAAVSLGVAELGRGRADAAVAPLEQALEKRPGDPFALLKLGIAQLQLGATAVAGETLQRSVEADPRSYAAHYNLGRALEANGETEAAMREIQRAIDLNPDWAQAHLELAKLYASQQPPATQQARDHYNKALALGAPPDDAIKDLIQ